MQNYCKTIGALAAASALVAGNASAEVEYEVHAGYSSEYLFRGVGLGDNLAEFGFDAASKVDQFGFSAGMWAGAFNNPTASVYGPVTADENSIESEIDWYAECSYDFGFMTGSVGYIYYWNMAGLGVDNQEVYFQASRNFGWANLSLTYYWDMISNNGGNNGYTELAASHSWELSPCLNLNLSTNLGYLIESGTCTAWTTKLALDWGFAETAKLSPFVTFAVALGEEDSQTWTQTENEFVAGSMLTVSF